MKNKINIVLILFLLLGISCTVDEGCRKSKTVNMGISFYHVVNKDTTTVMKIDSITVQGLGVDSILYNNTKKLSKILVPLNKIVPESRFVITFDTIKDTITIEQTNKDEYLSLECGCIKVHSIDTVLTTNHFIDSVKISNHTVNTTNAEHLQIYN
ncbi:MAG: DUF6452 family protein [Paludibacter sp.]|jgi:hypothetical protein|nr:DUF6452 family protein [Paludibacter sp.]